MVYRIYVEKREGLENEARAAFAELSGLLGIRALRGVRLLNRYDVENIDEAVFRLSVGTVFAEPQLDLVYDECPAADRVFAVEYLPGQFDQRADSAAQCIQILSQVERPTIRTARVYLLEGDLSDADMAAIKKYLINPVEAREAALEKPETLALTYEIPTEVEVLAGFTALDDGGLADLLAKYGLAM